MIRQNRLFSCIYISGTGLAIAMTMTMFIILYVKFAPIYPEYNRSRTLVLNNITQQPHDTTSTDMWASYPSYRLVEMIRKLPHAESVSGISMSWGDRDCEASTEYHTADVTMISTDSEYWKVFDFEFVAGKPFTEADVVSSAKTAVVSHSFAKTFFGSDSDALDRTFDFAGDRYRIAGIVRDVPASMSAATAADVWIPHSNSENYERNLLGAYNIVMTVKTPEDADVLKAEVDEMLHKYSLQDKNYRFSTYGPTVYWKNELRDYGTDEWERIRNYVYILVALLFIPALNLSGMISSKMNKRLPELGIRKTYGATNRQLLNQVLWENLLLTLIGGIVGVVLSYLLVMASNDWIINLLNSGYNEKPVLLSGEISPEMMLNWWIFGLIMVACFILNIISAIIPAVMSLRHGIINSLNSKQ